MAAGVLDAAFTDLVVVAGDDFLAACFTDAGAFLADAFLVDAADFLAGLMNGPFP